MTTPSKNGETPDAPAKAPKIQIDIEKLTRTPGYGVTVHRRGSSSVLVIVRTKEEAHDLQRRVHDGVDVWRALGESIGALAPGGSFDMAARGEVGGTNRAKVLSKSRRSEIAREGAKAMWKRRRELERLAGKVTTPKRKRARRAS